ncbi:TRAP transporter small permease [Peribacillus saganii]|uniref:TRAP transporter small permease n=1 Tax=Peribacillus saganii TaxID=2303992 RepID=A0A372LTD3_9BACI|nr:TRAP transporter small permease [Peribacillus saganii]RFU71471.1 TRAP transporter small permease [Peribacillus saganii]
MKSLKIYLDKTIGWIEKVFIIIASILLIAMVAIICLSVFGRFLFNNPFAWSVEISEYMMVFITFFTASWILKNDGHVKLEIFVSKLNKSVQMYALIIAAVVGAIACSLLAWFSFNITINYFQRDIVLLKIIDMPHFIVIAPIFLGSLVMALRYISILIGTIEEMSGKNVIELPQNKLTETPVKRGIK